LSFFNFHRKQTEQKQNEREWLTGFQTVKKISTRTTALSLAEEEFEEEEQLW